MAESYFLEGRKEEPACFDYFFRKLPYHGGFAVFAGLQDVLNAAIDLHFTAEDLSYLKDLNFHDSFLEYLKTFRFRGNIYACQEGELVFPYAPILRVEASIIEAQVIETLLLNILNFETLIATKASRIKLVAGKSSLSEFGLRRAQGMGGILATRAALIGGFDSTSNVYGAQLYDVPVSGTMAHAFIQSYDNELEAFRAFAKSRPENCIFLVDTYDTLKSGVPNAIIVAREMEHSGHPAKGIRLDSGDLAYLSKAARQMFDEAGLPYMKIAASNQLDEFVIKSLHEQGAVIDIFGMGTRLVTGLPDGALDGVYKLSMASGKPRMKLSETVEKTTLPGIKQVYRVIDTNGMYLGADAIVLNEEQKAPIIHHPYETGKSLQIDRFEHQPLLQPVMQAGKLMSAPIPIREIANYASQRLSLLPQEFKRFENPHIYKVGLSKQLLDLRNNLMTRYK